MLHVMFVLALSVAADAPPAPRHIIYLHGRIVQEQQSARPKHSQHGFYELDAIASALRKRGFVVAADLRAKEATVGSATDDVVAQVRALLKSGVPAGHITVVGASMGAAIAMRAAARLGEPDVRFAFLGPCASISVAAVAAEEGRPPAGRLLFVREESDVPSKGCPPPAAAREIVINTGLGHGFLYRPIGEWLDPVVDWASASLLLPPRMLRALDAWNPTFRPWHDRDYQPGVRRVMHVSSSAAPFAVLGDYNGDGREDAAIHGRTKTHTVEIVLLSDGDEYRVITVDEKRGVTDPKDEWYGVGGGRREYGRWVFLSRRVGNCFEREFLEKATSSFCWDGKQFVETITGD